MAAGIIEIDDSRFETDVMKSQQPVLVDFWAPWCGPCRAMAPVLEDLSKSFGDKIKIMKCNVDDNPVTPAKFEIKSIPTLIFFKDGKVFEQIVGITTKSKLEETIKKMV
ncbi:MAG: thioredoxin [Thermodesulfobacteriota bacterium]